MKDLIKKYFKFKIECKKSLKKEIKRIDEIVRTLALAQAEQNMFLEEYKKESYKTKFKNEHKKLKDFQKQTYEKIKILEEENKKLKKENQKLVGNKK